MGKQYCPVIARGNNLIDDLYSKCPICKEEIKVDSYGNEIGYHECKTYDHIQEILSRQLYKGSVLDKIFKKTGCVWQK